MSRLAATPVTGLSLSEGVAVVSSLPAHALLQLVPWGSDGLFRLEGLEVYGSHTAGHSLVQGGQVETDFRDRDEEKFADSVS